MATTFLDYLTLPNPEPDATQSKEGLSTKISNVYRPDKIRKWTDITWQNLEATFKDVLLGKTDGPKIKDSKEVSLEKRKIYEEGSVTSLAVDWNEPIVQHALEGTQKILRDKEPDAPISKGDLHFMANTGRGHIMNDKGIQQKPDWWVYQKGREDVKIPNLVPGESKPAKKWKSEWVKSLDPCLKRKAMLVIQQVVKYMYHGKTRYSFVLSEEEIVVVRLSRFSRDMEEVKKRIEKEYRRDHMLDSDGRFLESDQEEDDNANSDVSRRSNPDPNGSFADATRTVGLLLEYCSIPWSHNGSGTLTVNLTLWWLPMLAAQSVTIKESGKYTPLGEGTRGHSPEFVEQQAESQRDEEIHVENSATPDKRKSKEEGLDQPPRKLRQRRMSAIRSTGEPSQTESTRTRAPSIRNHNVILPSGTSATQSNIFNRAPRHITRRQLRKRVDAYQSDSSAKSSSQTTDRYQFSFQTVSEV